VKVDELAPPNTQRIAAAAEEVQNCPLRIITCDPEDISSLIAGSGGNRSASSGRTAQNNHTMLTTTPFQVDLPLQELSEPAADNFEIVHPDGSIALGAVSVAEARAKASQQQQQQ
jgi:hypothetical protein